jgi:hypothetical protein
VDDVKKSVAARLNSVLSKRVKLQILESREKIVAVKGELDVTHLFLKYRFQKYPPLPCTWMTNRIISVGI